MCQSFDDYSNIPVDYDYALLLWYAHTNSAGHTMILYAVILYAYFIYILNL